MKGENQLLEAYLHEMPCCLHVTGEDAYTFLQSQFSNDLPRNGGLFACYGLWLNVKGRVLADSVIVGSDSENFYIFSENTEAHSIKDTLENHIIADDVTIEPIQLIGAMLVNLPAAELLTRELGLVKDEVGGLTSHYINADFSVGAVFPRNRLGEEGFVFCFKDEAEYSLCRKVLVERSVHWISENEMHLRRLALGMPLVPDEIGPNDLAGEGDLVPSAASLTKGCYLGQEVVARLYHVGKAQRQLFVMTFNRLDDVDSIQLPFNITKENRSMGELRTLYQDANDSNKWYGVALLKVRYENEVRSEFKIGDSSVDTLCKLSEFSLSDK